MTGVANLTLGRSLGGDLAMIDALMPTEYLRQFAGETPDARAILWESQSWSYAQLDRAADAFVALLGSYGIESGDRIAYHGKNNDLYFAVMFGAMRAGVCLVPVNWRNTASETRFVLGDSGAKLVIVDAEFADIAAKASTNALPTIIADATGPEGLRDRLLSTSPADNQPLDRDAPILQLYTSGTTGKPKGVLTTQRMLAAQRQAEFASGYFDDWGSDEILFSPLPNFHIGGMSWALTAFVRGLPLLVTGNPAPDAILDRILTEKVTRAFMVPTLVRALIGEIQTQGVERLPLRAIHYGAAAMDPQLLARSVNTLGCRFLQYYGMTEASGSVSILGPDYHDSTRPERLRSVGRALPGFTLEIRDSNGGLVPVDFPGEIWIKGPSLTAGYWNRPDATAEALVDGWYRSGDGGRIDVDGFLTLTDRIKDMVVSGGENVYPAEVEAVLREHPAVFDCAVFGLPHEKWGEGVTAAIETRAGVDVTAEVIIAFARAHLAAYKIPRRIELGVTLPRTASGKVQRNLVRDHYLGQIR